MDHRTDEALVRLAGRMSQNPCRHAGSPKPVTFNLFSNGKLPFSIEANYGQTDAWVKILSRPAYSLVPWVT
jgi:hypothetical protein